MKRSIGMFAAAAVVAALSGCAVVPLAPPPLYIGVHANGGHGYARDGGYYGGNYGGSYGGNYGGYYGGNYGGGYRR